MTDNPSTLRLLQPQELQPAVDLTTRILADLDAVLLGQQELHRLVLAGVLSRGHILLEGMPGVGKTVLIKTLGQIMSLSFNRVQFTPDLMPSDILGTTILQQSGDGQRRMVFQPGPIFTNILLADEINRASPKTQAAMLEAMQERRVTVGGETRPLSDPFFVLASQNPIDLEGTYPLPEAQVDRFLFKLHVQQPDVDVLETILDTRRRGEAVTPQSFVSEEQLRGLFGVMERIVLPSPVARYIARLVAASHPSGAEQPGAEVPDVVKQYVTHGASPRAAIAMAESARAVALLAGRPTVGFEDVDTVAPHVLNHRLILSYPARFDKVTAHDVVRGLIDAIDEAELNLPAGMRVEQGAAE
ncbi:AAA family ATPase [Algisphaera agarilytica]|uniref:MoxR-like ATPase n=1 Tax=Algisphaera agarilytica TaxID=1385975 RepID=A0A7X0H433_9BACT|nr:AAA family ATPase [Algisphaera agarilytica]MBB6428839.1 MoxR-like ATPase [Algisphaera agarilytica]